jgi:hypothetical protein
MKLRKHMVLVVGGGTALVLMLVALFMLYRFYRAYDRVNMDLQSTMGQLRTLQDRAPYPSRGNVKITQTNVVVFQDYFNGLFESLRQGQIEPVEMEAAKFTPLLRDGILRVSKQAQDAGVILPTTFAMGVERYKQGALPSGADVPRLVVQLKTLEALCGMLIDAKVSEILSVRRKVFEQGAAAQEAPPSDAGRFGRWGPGGGGPAPEAPAEETTPSEVVDPSGLFSIEHYTIEFKCHERSLWDILNVLAKSKLFTVVTSVSVANDNPVAKIAPKAPAPAAPVASAAPATPSVMPGARALPGAAPVPEVKTQDERIIAGRELVKVVLDIDVYRFLSAEKQEAKL